MRLTGHSLGYGGVAYGAVAVYGTAAATTAAIAVGGLDGGARKRRYVVRKDGQLLVFSSRESAELALQEAEPVKVEAPAQIKPKAKGKNKATKAVAAPPAAPAKARQVEPPAPPLQVLDIAFILAMARIRGQAKAAQEMLARQRYEALLDLAWQMQDDDDIEMLLMAVH